MKRNLGEVSSQPTIRWLKRWKTKARGVVPGIVDFLNYSLFGLDFKYRYLSGTKLGQILANAGIYVLELYRRPLKRLFAQSKRFHPPKTIWELAESKGSLGLGHQAGRPVPYWEMIELIESGWKTSSACSPLRAFPTTSRERA